MQRKMDLLERAHGLLCNTPGDGGSAEDGDTWRRLRSEWIERWSHVIKDQQTKERNARITAGNDAVRDYERRCKEALAARSPLDSVVNLRVVGCSEHGMRAVDINGREPMCGDCRVLGTDGYPLGWQDGLDASSPETDRDTSWAFTKADIFPEAGASA